MSLFYILYLAPHKKYLNRILTALHLTSTFAPMGLYKWYKIFRKSLFWSEPYNSRHLARKHDPGRFCRNTVNYYVEV